MKSEKLERIEALYDEARQLDRTRRAAFIASRCAGDDELRREIESLLEHEEQAGEFLEMSAIEVLATAMNMDDRSMVGRRIGNYEILSLIGRGGMGQVWRARDTRLGREVAIKMLPDEFAADRDRVARFRREAQVLASLNHPGIAAIYGFEEYEGIHCLILEFVEGETLADRVKRMPIPVEESLRLMVQVAEALEAAHEKGVVHRDLKPTNIVVNGDGQTKLLDFGLAKAMEVPGQGVHPTDPLASSGHLSGLSVPGTILGTAAYMSPEQARGAAVDKRTDIWALGCVIYELLTGRRAFTGEMVSDVIASILAREPDDTLLDRFHPALRRVVHRCLQKDVKQRFRDVGDVRIELTHVLARPAGSIVRASRRHVPARKTVLALAAVALLVAVAAGVAGWYVRTPPPAPSGRFVVSAFPSMAIRLSGLTTDLAISPDGSTVAYGVEVDGHRGLYLRAVDRLEGSLLSDDALDTPFFSPDSASIGFYALSEGTLKRMPLAGGPTATIVELPVVSRGASWGPDDTVVFATTDGSTGLFEVPARGGDAEILTTPAAGEDHLWPEFLPGGDAVLFTIRSGLGAANSQVAILDMETGIHEILIPQGGQARYAATGHIVYGVDDQLMAARFDPDTRTVLSEPVPVLDGVVPSDSGAAAFAFSDEGSLAYVGGPPLEDDRILAFVDRDGGMQPLDLPAMPFQSPRLSPDETRVAVQVTDDDRSSIWVYELNGNAQGRELTPDGNNTRPVWTANGRRVTFASDRDGTWGIYWQPADGSAPAVRLTTAAEGNQHWPESWSTDGRTLSYVVVDGEARGIWTLAVEDGQVRQNSEFYDAEGFHENGSLFSPDGEWLAYYSNESNSDNQIWVQPVPRSGIRHRITIGGGVFPLWSPGGSELFYRRPGTAAIDGTRLIAVDIEDPDTYVLGPERALPISGFSVFSTYRDYDIAGDGERFLMVFSEDRVDSDGPPLRQVNLVFNWFEELAERVLP